MIKVVKKNNKYVVCESISINKAVDIITTALKNANINYKLKVAGTGTNYITTDLFNIRVANHFDVYTYTEPTIFINVSDMKMKDIRARIMSAISDPSSVKVPKMRDKTQQEKDWDRERRDREQKFKNNWKKLRDYLIDNKILTWKDKKMYLDGVEVSGNKKQIIRDYAKKSGLGAGTLFSAVFNGKKLK